MKITPPNTPNVQDNYFHQAPFQPKAAYVREGTEDPYSFKVNIFQDTLYASFFGYINSKNQLVQMDLAPMQKNTETYTDQVSPLAPMQHPHTTIFQVITEDTFQVMLKRKAEGGNPVGINMANRYRAGGGVLEGCPAQEEALCRRSNHILGLETQPYPFPENGGIYCPHVQIFREDEAHGFAFMDAPVEVALVASAAYDLRDGSQDRHELGFPIYGPIDEATLLNNQKYMKGTATNIRNMLRTMSAKGHAEIVLGALGCGAFHNPPTLIAQIFQNIFQEEEFLGRFKSVDFAILQIFPNDHKNVAAFQQICKNLGCE